VPATFPEGHKAAAAKAAVANAAAVEAAAHIAAAEVTAPAKAAAEKAIGGLGTAEMAPADFAAAANEAAGKMLLVRSQLLLRLQQCRLLPDVSFLLSLLNSLSDYFLNSLFLRNLHYE